MAKTLDTYAYPSWTQPCCPMTDMPIADLLSKPSLRFFSSTNVQLLVRCTKVFDLWSA